MKPHKDLIEEAIERGFVKGAKFISPQNAAANLTDEEQVVEREPYFYISGGIAVKDNEGVIYLYGEWATITESVQEEKEIIGYKLAKPEYKEAALKLSNTVANWENSLAEYDISVKQINYINRLTEAGVLDLWFEPVYKRPFKEGDIVYWSGNNPTFGELIKGAPKHGKCWYLDEEHDSCHESHLRHATPEEIEEYNKVEVGDYVYLTGDREGGWLKDYKGNVVKIVKNPTQYASGMLYTVETSDKKTGGLHPKYRKASKSEIKAFEKEAEKKLPTFLGYKGKDEGEILYWGCFGIYKSEIRTLERLGITTFTLKYENKTVVVGEEDFNIIKQYI